MSQALHLAPSTPAPVFDAVCEAVTGARITEETRQKMLILRQARIAAAMPDRKKHCAPLRELARREFKNVQTTLPEDFESVAEYLEFYVSRHHPDVRAMEDFMRKGLGVFRAVDYARTKGLNVVGPCGATNRVEQVAEILEIQNASSESPVLPEPLARRVTGLVWR